MTSHRSFEFTLAIILAIAPAPLHAGENAAATARLAWDASGSTTDLSPAPERPFYLYLIIERVQSIRSLAVDLRWSPFTTTAPAIKVLPSGGPPPESVLPPVGWTEGVRPNDAFRGDSTYTWTIRFSSPPRERAIVAFLVDARSQDTPATFCLSSVRTEDAHGDVDDLTILESATVLRGSGAPCPPSLFQAIPALVRSSNSGGITLRGQHFRRGQRVALHRDAILVEASSVNIVDERTLHATFDAFPPSRQAYDVLLFEDPGHPTSLNGAVRSYPTRLTESRTDTTRSALPAKEPPVHSARRDSQRDPTPASACPAREGFPLDFEPHGAVYATWPCTFPGGGSHQPYLCNITDYPSIPGTPVVKTVTYGVACADTALLTYLDLVLDILPVPDIGGHCHGPSSSKPVGDHVLLPSELPCTPLPGGGIRCAANSGADGMGLTIRHTWPDVASSMSLAFYSTTYGQPFYNDTAPLWTYCASQGAVISDYLQPLPDTLLFIGGNAEHPLNHYSRYAAAWALNYCARDLGSHQTVA